MPDTKPAITYWQLDFTNDDQIANLKGGLDAARTRLDSALFKHLAMLAPVAVGGMGMFLRGSGSGGLSPALIAMVAVPAAILVLTVMLSAISLALAPTNVVQTANPDGSAVTRSRDDWAEVMRHAVERTNWHRGFEDNVQFYGFAVAAFVFLVAGAWAVLG